MAETLSPIRKNAWINFFVAHAVLVKEIDRRMVEHGVIPLDVYDVLVTLEDAPGHRLRMGHLADAVFISRSGLTRLVDRLAAEDLVERVACPNDRRAQWTQLTAKGLAERERAWPVYQEAVAELFGSKMTQVEAALMSDIFRRMTGNARRIGEACVEIEGEARSEVRGQKV